MKQYQVLQPISRDRGPVIMPAGEDMPPVVVSEDVLFADPRDLPNARRAAILIALGDIREVPSDEAAVPAQSESAQAEPDAPEPVVPASDDAPAAQSKRKRDA